MRRIARFTILLIMVFVGLTVPASASDVTYYQMEASTDGINNRVTVVIPNDFLTFTRDSSPDDPNFSVLGTDATTFKDYLQQNDIYIEAIAPDFSTEIFIIMKLTKDSLTVGNYNRFTDKEMMGFHSGFQQGLESQGLTLLGYEIHNSGSQKYLYMTASVPFNSYMSYCEIYGTVVNKYQIGFYFKNYVGEVTDAQKKVLRQIVASAEFYPKDDYISSSSSPSSSFATSFLSNVLKYAVIAAVLAGGRWVYAAIKKGKRTADGPPNSDSIPRTDFPAPNCFAASDDKPGVIITCPTCGMKNQSDRLVCYRCGRTLNPKYEVTGLAAGESGETSPSDSADN